jgi:hypothetical protein
VRQLAVVLSLVLIAASCGDDGGDVAGDETTSTSTTAASSTTSEPTTTSVPATTTSQPALPRPTAVHSPGVWSVLQSEDQVPTTVDDGLALLTMSDGRARVIYGVGTTLRMATCIDTSCDTTEVVDVWDTAPFAAGLQRLTAPARADGSPVIVSLNVGAEPPPGVDEGPEVEQRLVWCEDPDCASATSAVLPTGIYRQPSLATSPDGRVGIFDTVNVEPLGSIRVDQFVGFTYCDDSSCLADPADLTRLVTIPADNEDSSLGITSGRFDLDGRPLAVYQEHPASPDRLETDLNLVQCDDADCAAITPPQTVDTRASFTDAQPPMITEDGSLVFAYQALPGEGDPGPGGAITVTTCDSGDCEAAVANAIFENETMAASCCVAGALGPQGLPQVAWTTSKGFMFTSCTDLSCGGFDNPILMPYRALTIRMASAEGVTTIATADSRDPSIAPGPNIAPGVWLMRCALDQPCDPPDPPS